MKKLMIAAAIVCAAAMSQAASVDWNYADYSEDSDQANFTVYCIAGALQSAWDSVDAVKEAAMPGGTAVVIEGKRSTETGDQTAASQALTKESGYFFVVVNDTEDKFGVMAGDNFYVYDPEAQQTSPGTFSFDGVATTSSFGGGPGPSPVPEPTSGLLLLLGVAGLALKRKRA